MEKEETFDDEDLEEIEEEIDEDEEAQADIIKDYPEDLSYEVEDE